MSVKPYLLIAVLFIAVPAFAQNVTNSTFYQGTAHQFANGSGANTETLAYTHNNLAGDLLWAVAWWNGAVTLSITDTNSNSWTCRPSMTPTGTIRLQMCYALNAVAGANTLTYHFSGAGGTFIEVAQNENSGVDTFDTSVETTGSGNPSVTGNLTATHASELLISYDGKGAGDAGAHSTSYPWFMHSAADGYGSEANIALGAADYHNVAVGTYSNSISTGIVGTYGAGIAAFYNSSPPAAISTQTDTFVRANENPLSNGGKWTISLTPATTNLQIISNFAVNGIGGGNGTMFWNAATFPDDQFACVLAQQIGTSAGTGDFGPVNRVSQSSSAALWYFGAVYEGSNPLGNSQQLFISKFNGGETVLAVQNYVVNVGDQICLQSRGPVIRELLNGVVVLLGVDTATQSGYAGFHVFDATTTNKVSTWTGGALASPVLGSFTDTFNRANGAVGSTWVNSNNSVLVSNSTAVGSQASDTNAAIYTGGEFPADQNAQATIAVLNSSDFVGPACRMSGTTLSSANPSVGLIYYDLVENTTTLSLRKVVIDTSDAPTITVIATTSITGVVGDVLQLLCSGSTLTGYRNGVAALGPSTNSTVIAGYPGLSLYGTSAKVGNFQAGPSASLTATARHRLMF